MGSPTTHTIKDMLIEQEALRKHGMVGRGREMGNSLYAIDYDCLPPEARTTIKAIINGGPFPYPTKDGSRFGDSFGDLPNGAYLEYTVPTPGIKGRGRRRIVARLETAQLFFTACHYERVHASGGTAEQRRLARIAATHNEDDAWRNGFYIITGMTAEFRSAVSAALKKLDGPTTQTASP